MHFSLFLLLTKVLSEFLSIFEEATREIEATKRPTLHLVVPWHFRILHHCQASSADSVFISQLKITAVEYFSSNVANHITDFHKVATFLCPTFKPLRMYHSTNIKNQIIDTAREMLAKLLPEESDTNRSRVQPFNRSTVTNTSQALSMFEGEADGFQEEEDDEIQNYINEHVIRMNECLLDWSVFSQLSISISEDLQHD